MSIFNKPFEEIVFEDIEALVQQRTTENQSLEFKQVPWTRDDEGGREMLRDITSMANAYGGYIIIGVGEETDGTAKEIATINDAETERDRITSLCLASVEPRIADLKINCLNKEGRTVIIIYVSSSLRAPYLITYKGLYQFWNRHDRQKSKMSVEEVRDQFLKNYNITENTERFLDKRNQLILKSLGNEATLILKAVPIDTRTEFVDIKDQELREKMLNQTNGRVHGWTLKFSSSLPVEPSFYGLKVGGEPDFRKLELHRNGYLEAVIRRELTRTENINENGVSIETKFLYPLAVIEYIYSFLQKLKEISNHINYTGQYSISVGLYKISEFPLLKHHYNGLHSLYYRNNYPGDSLELGLFSFDVIDPDKISKFLADRIWQSFGFEEAPLFKNGKFTPPAD